jgi:nitroreductase
VTLASRYGDDARDLDVSSAVLDVQLAHRSVRRFAPGDVSDEQLRALVAAAQSAPTSVQPAALERRWRSGTPSAKARLAELAAGQRFVAEAPLLLGVGGDLGRARRPRLAGGVAPSTAATTSRPR